MKIGKRFFRYGAYVTLSCNCVNGDTFIDRVYVPPKYRGRGLSLEMLETIVKEADQENRYLFCSICPDRTKKERDADGPVWYRKVTNALEQTFTALGFESCQEGDTVYRLDKFRKPKKVLTSTN